VAATGGNASTFLFDTNIEDLVPRVTKGLQAVQRAVNAESKGQATKLTSNLPRDLARLVNDSQKQVAQLNRALAETGKVKGGGSLTGGYQRIVDDLHRKIGQVTQGRGLTAEVGLRFAKGPIEALVKHLHEQLSTAALSANPKVSRNVGIGQFNPTKGQFEAGFNGDTAANKKLADSLKTRTATEAKLTRVAKETLSSDQTSASAAKTTASARTREAKARTTIADNAEKEATASTTRRRATAKKEAAAPFGSGDGSAQPAARRPAKKAVAPPPVAPDPFAGVAEARKRAERARVDREALFQSLEDEAAPAKKPKRKRKTKAERDAEVAQLQDVIDGIPQRKQTVTQKAAAAKVVQDRVDASRPTDQRVNDEAAQKKRARQDAQEAARAATTVPAAVRAATIPDVAVSAAPTPVDSSATAATAADWVASTQRSASAQQRLASIVDAMAAAAAAREARYRAEGAIPVKPVIPLGAEPRRQRELGQRGDTSGSVLDLPRLEAQQVQFLRALLASLRQQATAVRQTTDIITVTATLWNEIRREVQRVLEAARRRAAIEAGAANRPRAITGDTGARAIGAGGASTGGQLVPRGGQAIVPRGGQTIVPRDTRGELVPLATRPAPDSVPRRRLAIESGLNQPDPAPPVRNQPPALTPKQQREQNYRNLTNGLDSLQRGVKRIDQDFVADTRGAFTRIFKLVGDGFKEIERGKPEYFRQIRRFNAQQGREAQRAAGAPGTGSPISEAEREIHRRNQRDLGSGRGDNELARGVNPIGGVGSRFVSDTRGLQERIFQRTRDGFVEIARGTADFEALARRMRQQQERQSAAAGGGGRGGILNNFLSSFTSGSSFGGGNGQRPSLQGALEGLSRSAGTTAKYAVLGQTFYAIQSAAAAAGAEILDFADSVTNLNIALEGVNDDGKRVEASTHALNALTDSAALAGANVGASMDQASSAIRAFKDQTDGSQASVEALGVRFAAEAAKIKTITGGDLKDVSDNLKATALAFDTTSFSRVTDVIAGSKRVGGGAENDIQSGIAASAIAAKEAGFSLEETGVLISKIVAETSESGVLAATRFSKITAILGGSAGKNAIRQLNASLAPEQQVDVTGTIADQVKGLSAVYGQLGESQRQQLINSLGGTANARELIVILQNAATLTQKADEGFTGEGADEYRRRLEDIRAVLTRINGEFRGIITGLVKAGIFDGLFAAIKYGFLPALEITRQLIQGWNEFLGPIGKAVIYMGELYLIMKLMAAIGRTGILAGFVGRVRGAPAAAAAAARRAGAPRPVPVPAPSTRAERRAARAGGVPGPAGAPAGPRRSITGINPRADVFAPVRGATAAAGQGARTRIDAARERRLARLPEDDRRRRVAEAPANERRRQQLDRQIAQGEARQAQAQARQAQAQARQPALDRQRLAELRANRDARQATGNRQLTPEQRAASNQRIGERSARDADRRAAAAERDAQAARRAERSRLGPTPERTRFQRIRDAGTRAGLGASSRLGALGIGPGASRPLGSRIRSAGSAVGPELGIIAAALTITQVISATKRISAAVKEFESLKTLPTNFGAKELHDSALNLKSAAHSLREASSGFFGAAINFARGDETGPRADDLEAEAKVQEHASERIKRAVEKARVSSIGDLAATIDLSSSESIGTSLESLDSAGRSATTQLKALDKAMGRLSSSTDGVATKLSAVQKVQVSSQTGVRVANYLREQKEAARFNPTFAAKFSGSGPLGQNFGAGADAFLAAGSFGLIPKVRRSDNFLGRFARSSKFALGTQANEDAFQFGKVDLTDVSVGLENKTQEFLNVGGDILSEQGKTDLTEMYTNWLVQHYPNLKPDQIATLAKVGLDAATDSVKAISSVTDPAATLSDVLANYAPLAQKAAEEAGNAAAQGLGPKADQGQALATSQTYLDYLTTTRDVAAKGGASKERLEKFDNEITVARIANNANVIARQESRNQFALAKLGDSDASGRATLAREQADKVLEDAGYDPKTGKRKTRTVTITSDKKTFSDSRTSRGLDGVTDVESVTTTREENVGPGLSIEDEEKAKAAQLAAQRAEKAEQLKNKISARRLKVNPQDEVANAAADLQDAKDQRDALIAEGTTGAALDDAKLQVRKAKLNLAQTELDNSISARNVNAIPASSLDTAKRNLRDGQDRLKLLTKGTTAFNEQLAQNVQAQNELADAQADVASIQRQLKIDLTNPVQVAQEAVTTAKAALARAKEQTAGKDVDPLVRAQVVGTAELEVRNAEAQAEAAAFSQWLSNTETANSLGRISHKAYLSMLRNRADALTAELATMSTTDPMYQQIKDQRDQLLQSIKSSAEALSGQFNLGDIKIPSVYEVRRALKAGDRGEVLASNAALSTSGNVTNDTSTKNVILNGVPVQQVMQLIEDLFGIKARTKASRRTP
jgi:hypothetical protein